MTPMVRCWGGINIFNDRSVFEVEFPDGTVDMLAANIIAENLFLQIDEHGNNSRC